VSGDGHFCRLLTRAEEWRNIQQYRFVMRMIRNIVWSIALMTHSVENDIVIVMVIRRIINIIIILMRIIDERVVD